MILFLGINVCSLVLPCMGQYPTKWLKIEGWWHSRNTHISQQLFQVYLCYTHILIPAVRDLYALVPRPFHLLWKIRERQTNPESSPVQSSPVQFSPLFKFQIFPDECGAHPQYLYIRVCLLFCLVYFHYILINCNCPIYKKL